MHTKASLLDHLKASSRRIVAVAAIACLAAFALAGCSDEAKDNSRTPLQLDRAYMASINGIGADCPGKTHHHERILDLVPEFVE